MDILRILMLVLVTAGFSSISHALTITPENCTTANQCLTSDEHRGKDASVFSVLDGIDLSYKYETDDADETPAPMALLGDSYDMVSVIMEEHGDDDDDYAGATIRYVGGDIADCAFPCYLTVKGGRHSPSRYLFDLAVFGWDGMEDLSLGDFWPGKGSLSNFAIYGNMSPIPVPNSFWLFSTALVGFIGIARRISV